MSKRRGILSSDDNRFSWWWFGIKVGVVTALIVWWWLENRNKKTLGEASDTAIEDEILLMPLSDVEVSEKAVVETKPDDLTKIEGIGPKINTTLQTAGIRTYLQLAACDPTDLKQILTEAGIRLGFPDTWPEQAALAAKADWSSLEVFQSSLQGGRRVG